MERSVALLEDREMSGDEIVTVGKLVLIAVVVGAAIATCGPALSKALIKVFERWLN